MMISFILSACSFFSDEDNDALPAQPALKQQVPVNELWQVKSVSGNTKQYNKISPTIMGNQILLSDEKGKLVAINKSSGKQIWHFSEKMNFSGSAAYGDHQVYIGTSDANVLAINAQTGKLIWQHTVSDQIVGKPAYAKHIVVVKTLDGKLFGLRSSDGKQLWNYDEGNPELVLKGESDPVIVNGKVISGFPDGKMVVLNLETGNLVWEAQVADSQGFSTLARMVDINTTPVVSAGLVYVGTYQGNISAYALSTGHRVWEHKISTYSGLTVDGSNVYVTDADGVLWAFNKKAGTVNWNQKALKHYMLSGPTAYKKYVALGDNIGNLQLFMKKDGEAIARIKVSSKPIYAAPITDGKILYVFSSDGKLSAMRVG